MLRSIGKQSGESVESVLTPGEEKDPFFFLGLTPATVGRIRRKGRFLARNERVEG